MVVGLYIDKNGDGIRYRRYFTLWLYIFLCFGYMVGTDWRNYEPWYENIDYNIYRMTTEPLSGVLLWGFSKLGVDFWLFVGIAKCFYLGSSLYLLSKISGRWITCAALMVIGQYAFLLICNPLRFMLALIPINYSLYYLFLYFKNIKVKFFYFKIISLLFFAILFHNSCVTYIPIFICCFYVNRITSLNKVILIVAYFLFVLITSNVEFLNFIKDYTLNIFTSNAEMKDYGKYVAESNNAVFSIGNILRCVFFLFIISTRDRVINKEPNGKLIYGFSIIYCFVTRFCILIPTGFRIPLPFEAFYIVYIIYMLDVAPRFAYFIILYMCMSFSSNAWRGFEYIPYSNSIPYIILGHKPFQDRCWNNFNEHYERLGEWDARYYMYLNKE